MRWTATDRLRSYGLNRAKSKTLAFRDLPFNFIHKAVPTSKGVLWMTSEEGGYEVFAGQWELL